MKAVVVTVVVAGLMTTVYLIGCYAAALLTAPLTVTP